jgi:glycosyltransferase involved in cell wall biosynthesis/GR25 family glycosyltransferase involved in LPS biosynthesis
MSVENKKKVTLGVCIMVKNEEKIIMRSLNSIKDYADFLCVCDTGSTDNTKQIVKDFMKTNNISGRVYDHKWVNFGHNRTLSLQAARGCADFILLMDADMELVVLDKDFKQKLHGDEILLMQSSGEPYYNTRIISGSKTYVYIGVTHEYIRIKHDQPTTRQTLDQSIAYFADHADGFNRSEKYTRDIALLVQGLIDEPKNERYMYYLAKSYIESGKYEEAIVQFQNRINAGGWYEEVYYSYFFIAKCFQALGKPYTEIVDQYMKAYNYHKGRAEPLFEIIYLLRCMGKFEEAMKFADIALKIEYPKNDLLPVSKHVYDYRLKDEIALCANKSGHHDIAYNLWLNVLKEKKYPKDQEGRLKSNLGFALKDLKQIKSKKPILCFYIGYTADLNGENFRTKSNVYGSELALIRLAERLANFYDVYIYGACIREELEFAGVKYFNSGSLNDFQKKNTIEIMIISRYVHYFIEFTNRAKKTYVWMHDMSCQPYWNGIEIPKSAKYLMENVMPGIDGLIALTEWHKGFILEHYDVDPNKIFIIGNGINTSLFNEPVQKIKNRFIWSSAPNRGLAKLVEYFHEIRNQIPDATLHIYRGKEDFSQEFLDELAKYDYIYYGGALANELLVKEFQKAEIWFYPTNWLETYCISALEAQMAGCVCVCSNIGALINTVGNRGVLLKSPLYSDQYKYEAINAVVSLLKDENRKKMMADAAKKWATEQTWENRTDEWLQLFKYDKTAVQQVNLTANKTKVKLMSNHCSSQEMVNVYKKYCQAETVWDNIAITSEDTADYYCIINHPRPNEYYDPERTIVFKMEEKESSRPYFPKEWVDMQKYKYMNVFDERNSLEWHLSKTYTQLLSDKIVKTKEISAVISSEYRLDGHIKRVNFLKYLEENNFKLDHYGKDNKFGLKNYIGSLPYHKKDDGLFSYKYTFASENIEVNGYFTEKIVDAILAECLCFYWGCPDLETYVDSNAYIRLDLNDYAKSLQTIKEAIANNEWEKRIDTIRKEKYKIISEMQVMPVLADIIKMSLVKPNYSSDRMNKYWEQKEFNNCFHGDDYFIKFVENAVNKSDTFIETGTFRAASSNYIATKYPDKQIYSCETHTPYYELSKEYTRNLKNINFSNTDSMTMLNTLVNQYNKNTCTFFLDAHTHEYSPLKDELEFIIKNFENYYIFIDDFMVPGKAQFNYNKLKNINYTLDNIISVIDNKNLNIYFPNYDEKTSIYHPLVGWTLITNQQLDPETEKTFSVKKMVQHDAKYTMNVINLERRPDRLEKFREDATVAGINEFNVFKAFDGKTIELTDEMTELFHVATKDNYVGKRVPRHHQYNAAVFAVAFGHYTLWKNIANDPNASDNDAYVVFEDDISFVDDFNTKWNNTFNLLKFDSDWDLLYLGFNDDQGHLYGDYNMFETVKRFTDKSGRWHGGGAWAYCIRKKGAIKLIELAKKLHMEQPVDHFMIDQFDSIIAYRLNPYLASATEYGRGNSDTDIQNTTRKLEFE